MLSYRTILAMLCLTASMLCHAEDSIPQKKSFGAAIVGGLKSVIREFNNIDTSYIEPQHYKFSAMVQSTYFFERYRITSKSGQTITFAPETRIKVGPYAGWSLLFLGYTIDLAYISANKKRELDLSLYSSMIGVDLFYRRTGHEYNIKDMGYSILNGNLGEQYSFKVGVSYKNSTLFTIGA